MYIGPRLLAPGAIPGKAGKRGAGDGDLLPIPRLPKSP